MSTWPNDQQLGTFLVAAKLCQTPPDWLKGTMAAAVRQFEKDTGYSPFLADGAKSVRHDPPKDGRLTLACGFVSVTAVALDYSSTSDGSVLVEDTDYSLLPLNYADRGMCVDQIDFFYARGGMPRSVLVTGEPGRMRANSPDFDDVSFWLLRGAASSIALEAQGQEGPLTRLKQGPVEMEFAKDSASRIEGWATGYRAMVDRYRRILV